MKKIWTCRRTFLGFVGIIIIGLLGFITYDVTVCMSIATISIGIGAANAYERKKK